MRGVLFAVLLMTVPAMADGLPAAPFAALTGNWHCDGSFPASGKTISSDLRFVWDAATGTLTKHHDDVAPNTYHAIELWAAAKSGLQARIADSFGGVRDFTSAGWTGNTLTWQGAQTTPYYERFVYTKLDASTLRIDWDVSKDGAAYKTGDTLTCKKT